MGLFSGKSGLAVAGLGLGTIGLTSMGGMDALGGVLGSSAGQAGIQTLANSYLNRKAAKQQFAYTKALIDYENEYNSPKNQMARLAEAGLNPNLVYNNGSATIASATGSAPQVKPAQFDLLSVYNLQEQNKLLKAQANLTVDNALLTQERLNEQNAKSSIAQYNLDYAQQEHEVWEKTGKIPESYYKNQQTPQFILRLLENIAGA